MQNYIEKKTRKSIFHIFLLRKTNQEPRKSIFNFYFYKTYQHHNLLSETEQLSLDLRVFWFVLLKMSIIRNLVSDLMCFYLFFIIF